MGSDDGAGPSSSSSSYYAYGIDPRIIAAATTILLAASFGTWRVVVPQLERIRGKRSALADANSRTDTAGAGSSDKKKRQRDRRRRSTALRPSTQSALTLPGSGSGPPTGTGKKFVVRQPSGQRQRIPAAERINYENNEEKDNEPFQDDTPRPAEVEQNALGLGVEIVPENIELPPSPVPGRRHSLSQQRSRSPLPSPSPSASTSASTSGTPLTPPSLAASQLSLPPMSAAWDCSWSTTTTNTKHSRSRGRSPRPPRQPDFGFPTLNPLPPPNTPLEAQIEYMKHQLKSYKAREQNSRNREESLLHELDELRADAESSRSEAAKLQWQLNEMAQREERLQAQLNSLMLQMQGRHPMPLYQPQPMPYPPHHHPGFYHAHPPYSPIAPPLTPSLMSPTHIHPSPPLPTQLHPLMSVLPAPAWRTGAEADVSPGLMEAILKRPESYGRGSPSLSMSGSGNSRSASALGARLDDIAQNGDANMPEEIFEGDIVPQGDLDERLGNTQEEKTPELPLEASRQEAHGAPVDPVSAEGNVQVFY